MGEKIVIGPIDKGLQTNRTAFNIDNDAFPNLINAYQWRGRIKRKRGTSFLNRLTRYFNSDSPSYTTTATITLNGSGVGNLIDDWSLETNGSIKPGTVTITAPGPTVYTDPGVNGTLSPSGSINYASGEITILAEAGNAVSAIFTYYPDLPVMGIENFQSDSSGYPEVVCFDTTYAYNLVTSYPYNVYDISFYKYIQTGTYSGYTQKTDVTPLIWNGETYQQFWSINYQNALWVSNGVQVPFAVDNIGMQFKSITGVAIGAAGPPATVDLTIMGHGLVVGDFIFVNEVGGMTGINFQTGYVTVVGGINTVTVVFPNATIAGAYTSGGIAQYLTNTADPTIDCIRWYDGDPTNGSITLPVFNTYKGWVNFMPPLSEFDYTIADLPQDQYYLVGAKLIATYKDRLIFLGPVVQSSTGSPIYLEETVLYSQNGTPYYTCSFTGDPSLSSTTFNPILVPENQTATPNSFWEDQTGFGGFKSTGVDQPITSVSSNKDALIVGFTNFQTRLVYTENDIDPFNFYIINNELGTGSSFSTINMDAGVVARGSRGFTITSQTNTERIDLPIPDNAFEVSLLNNGAERFTSARDFINEWIYFTYSSDNLNGSTVYPNQTLQWNYRDNSWALFNESYTTYGTIRSKTGPTWTTIGEIFPTWGVWSETWNAGSTNVLQPKIIGGNQQGFLIQRDDGTSEAKSLFIQDIVNSTITSPSHSLNNGDYIIISDCLGTVSSKVNDKIFQINSVSTNTFDIVPQLSAGLTYLGLGQVKRMYIPFIQTKQFPVAWNLARKTRLGPQQYLLTKTALGQVTLLIFLSQDNSTPYNTGAIVPAPTPENNALIYSAKLYTCPESTNLGLTASNINLQMPTSINQQQIWHRLNTSLLGDTVQIGITLSNEQMTDLDFKSQFAEIELHSIILDVTASSLLA